MQFTSDTARSQHHRKRPQWKCVKLHDKERREDRLQGGFIAGRETTVYAWDTHCRVEELWSGYTSFLPAGPRGGPPDALRGRMLQRFRAEDMATDSPFWNTVQMEAAALVFPTPLVASRDTDTLQDRTTTVPASLSFESAPAGSRWYALEDKAGFKAGDTISIEPGDITSSCGLRVLVSHGRITFAAASSSVAPMHVGDAETDVRTLSVRPDPRCEPACAFSDAVHKRWKNTPCTTSRSKDHGPRTGSCSRWPERVGASGTAPLVETSHGAATIGSWSRQAHLLLLIAWSRHAVRPGQSSRHGSV